MADSTSRFGYLRRSLELANKPLETISGRIGGSLVGTILTLGILRLRCKIVVKPETPENLSNFCLRRNDPRARGGRHSENRRRS